MPKRKHSPLAQGPVKKKKRLKTPKKTPKKEGLTMNQKKQRCMLIKYEQELAGISSQIELIRTFETRWGVRLVQSWVSRNITKEAYAQWKDDGTFKRKKGPGPKFLITKEMEPQIKKWIEDDSLKMKDVIKKIKTVFNVEIKDEKTIRKRFKRSRTTPDGYTAHVTPMKTPLSKKDEKIRLAYAMYGPINNWTFEDVCNGLNLPKTWRERKLKIAFWDHKPFYLGKFHRFNHRQYRFKNSKKDLEPRRKEKFAPMFMVFGCMCWHGCLEYFHSNLQKNVRRSRNADGELVYKYQFKHQSVDQKEVNKGALVFVEQLKAWGIKLLIGDCDAKLHNRGLEELLLAHGIMLWPGGGKGSGKHPIGYPPRSHDCNPCEQWFSQWQEMASAMMDLHHKNAKGKNDAASMKKWRLSLQACCKDFPLQKLRDLINTQRKAMKAIIANEGGRTKY